jgi:hypothetical protein
MKKQNSSMLLSYFQNNNNEDIILPSFQDYKNVINSNYFKDNIENIDDNILNETNMEFDILVGVHLIKHEKKFRYLPNFCKHRIFLNSLKRLIDDRRVNQINTLEPILYLIPYPLGQLDLRWVSTGIAYIEATCNENLKPFLVNKTYLNDIDTLYWFADCGVGKSVYPNLTDDEILNFPVYNLLKDAYKKNNTPIYIYGGDIYYYSSDNNLENTFNLWKKSAPSMDYLNNKLVFCAGNHDYYNENNAYNFLNNEKKLFSQMFDKDKFNSIKYYYKNHTHVLVLNSTYYATGFALEDGSLLGNIQNNEPIISSYNKDYSIESINSNYQNNTDNYDFTQYNIIINMLNEIENNNEDETVILMMHHPMLKFKTENVKQNTINNNVFITSENNIKTTNMYDQLLNAIDLSNWSNKKNLNMIIISGHVHCTVICDPISYGTIKITQIINGNAGFLSKNINNIPSVSVNGGNYWPKNNASSSVILGYKYVNRAACCYSQIDLSNNKPKISLHCEELQDDCNEERTYIVPY